MIAHLLNVEIEVWRRTTTPDGSGGGTEAWESQGTYPARVSPIERITPDLVVAGAEAMRRMRVVYLDDADADVQRGDRVVLSTDAGPRTMNVEAWDSPSIPIYRRLEVEEVQAGG